MIIDTNLKNRASSQYQPFNINSMCKFNGGYWAAGPGGLYTANAVDSTNIGYFIMATMDFGINNDKRIRYVYLSFESTDDLTLTISTEKVDAKNYKVSVSDAGQQDVRITISRILHGRFWIFKISGTCDFSIDEIKIRPIIRGSAH